MGEVYQATDTNLKRQVAIKVLPASVAGDADRLARFQREAEVLAALNHPHIAAIYGLEKTPDGTALVMELVEGDDLSQRIARGAMPIDEALPIAKQIAEALEAAHEQGIIHRDLKPANIKVRSDGTVKVLDFGLAKALDQGTGVGDQGSGCTAHSPTITAPAMTQAGMILGTAAYMAPEQARGKTVDKRADIWAFGVVLFEMLSGSRAFEGDGIADTLGNVMKVEPPWQQLPTSVPPRVVQVVRACLEKNPRQRLGDMQSVRLALDGVFETASLLAGVALLPARATPVAWIAFAVAVAVVATGVAMYEWAVMRREQPEPVVRFTIEVPATMLTANISIANNIAVSPDGNTIAYVGANESGLTQLIVRTLDELAPRSLAGTSGAQSPIFSPDGKWISYQLASAVWKVSLTGDAPISLNASVPTSAGSSWSPSGVIVSASTGGIWIVPANGGVSKLLKTTQLADDETNLGNPFALADGEHVLFTLFGAGGNQRARLACVSLKTGEVTKYELSVLSAIGVSNGVLIYVTPAGSLQAVGFDEKSLRVTGEPVALGVTVTVNQSGAAGVAMSPTGTLIYGSSALESQVGWVSETGLFAPIIAELKPYLYPRLAPDGKRIVLTARTGARSDVWVYDLASKTPQRLTNEGTMNERAEWTPDGTRVIYRSDRGKRSGIWWQPADLSAPATSILSHDAHDYYEGVLSPDGKLLVYQVDDGTSSSADLFVRALEGDTTQKAVSVTDFVEAQARVSPDGKWVAFVSDASGTAQVLVQPFPGAGAQVQVSVTAGTEPIWSRDGKKIFYRDGVKMIAASVAAGSTFSVTARTPLFTDTYVFAPSPHANFDVSQDGSKFLMVKSATTSKIVVVHGWFTEMRTRLTGQR